MEEYTVGIPARLRQEEIAREIAHYRCAGLVERHPLRDALRQRLAAMLVAVASRLTPAEQPAIEIIEASTANS